MGRVGAVGDALLVGPEHGLVIISGLLDVGEGMRRNMGLRAAHGAPEEGYDLTAGTGLVGREMGLVGTRGDLGIVVVGPEHRIVVELAGLHVHEGVLRGEGNDRAGGEGIVAGGRHEVPGVGLVWLDLGSLRQIVVDVAGHREGAAGHPELGVRQGLAGVRDGREARLAGDGGGLNRQLECGAGLHVGVGVVGGEDHGDIRRLVGILQQRAVGLGEAPGTGEDLAAEGGCAGDLRGGQGLAGVGDGELVHGHGGHISVGEVDVHLDAEAFVLLRYDIDAKVAFVADSCVPAWQEGEYTVLLVIGGLLGIYELIGVTVVVLISDRHGCDAAAFIGKEVVDVNGLAENVGISDIEVNGTF